MYLCEDDIKFHKEMIEQQLKTFIRARPIHSQIIELSLGEYSRINEQCPIVKFPRLDRIVEICQKSIHLSRRNSEWIARQSQYCYTAFMTWYICDYGTIPTNEDMDRCFKYYDQYKRYPRNLKNLLGTSENPINVDEDEEMVEHKECSLCFEKPTRGEAIKTFLCGHSFHRNDVNQSSCQGIKAWFDNGNFSCPNCRVDLSFQTVY